MSIYSDFEARIDASTMQEPNSREASLQLIETSDGMILGIKYACDARYEEEAGVGKMAATFARTAHPENFMAQEYLKDNPDKSLLTTNQSDLLFLDEFTVGFGAEVPSRDYSNRLQAELKWCRSTSAAAELPWRIERRYAWTSVADLKAAAKARGLKGYSRLKSKELVQLLSRDDLAQENAGKEVTEVTSQPGSFHYGDLLVFERKAGLFGEVLERLIEAAKEGFLAVGGGGGPFGGGFTLFDARDLTEATKSEIAEQSSWRREQLALLEPVANVVQEGPMKNSWGSAYYALGRPSIINGEIKFWLNGSSVYMPNGRSVQPCGWYTLQELLDEKYMDDARAQSDEDFKRFFNGNYRTEKLTDAQAEAELRAHKLTWASKPMSEVN